MHKTAKGSAFIVFSLVASLTLMTVDRMIVVSSNDTLFHDRWGIEKVAWASGECGSTRKKKLSNENAHSHCYFLCFTQNERCWSISSCFERWHTVSYSLRDGEGGVSKWWRWMDAKKANEHALSMDTLTAVVFTLNDDRSPCYSRFCSRGAQYHERQWNRRPCPWFSCLPACLWSVLIDEDAIHSTYRCFSCYRSLMPTLRFRWKIRGSIEEQT